ncbi:MAG: C45 family autoproteolytic acyltransferase/hydrolase [Spirochaetaceae bacterium]|nr:C45 family autoproteolytic acyltransferase/hydrolase [Spirochaetaceae bacterium]
MIDDRLVRAAGTAGERGASIGAAAGERIRALLEAQDREHRDRDGLTLRGWLPAARRFEPLIREHAPVTAEEIAGMAAGAGLPADELLLLACAYEKYLGPAPAPAPETDGHCTALGAAGDATVAGDVICGQNNDELIAGWLGGAADVIVHHTADDGLQTLLYTHAGVPAYMGMNSARLCVTWMYIDNGERGAGLPTCVLIRELLTMRSLADAVEYLDGTPHAVPNAFLLGHPQGLRTVEVFPHSRMRVREGTHLLWHANHILDEELASADRQTSNPNATTFSRCERMGELLCEHRGRIDVGAAQRFLSDHGSRHTICQHAKPQAEAPGKTLASMVFEPAAGTMHLAFGNGCEEPYAAYRFDG